MSAAADPMVEQMIAEGEQAINSLPEHASRISELLRDHFPPQTLAALHEAMRPSVVAARGGVNTKVAELSSLLREEAAVAGAQFRACELWIRLKQPAVSDGNNFGVDVQNYVLEQLSAMRTSMEGMTTSGKDYFWSRGTGLEKLFGDEKTTTTTTEDSSAEVKEGKASDTSKKATSKSAVSTKLSSFPDYSEYVVSVDVRQYHQVFNHLTDMRNNYLKAHILFSRNMRKLADPRGDGDGKSANVMSMF